MEPKLSLHFFYQIGDLVTVHKFTTYILILSSNLHQILTWCYFLIYCTFVSF